MKRTYTILFLSITILTFAQSNKVEETSKEGYYFKQVGDKIEVWRGYPSAGSGSNNSGYSFRKGEKSGTIEVVSNNRRNVPPASSFSSPNEVKVTQDAAGNKYWTIIDGTVVKTELASNTSSVKPEQKNIIKEVSKEPVKTVTVDKSITPTPKKEVQTSSATKVVTQAPAVIKTESKDSVKISQPNAVISVKEENPVKTQVIAPVISETKTQTLSEKPTEVKNITIEELDTPSGKEIQINTNNDPNEKIQVESGDVGDVTDLFEKNYENMTNKEKKLYRKNEKKIMKQLEAELKQKGVESN